MAWVDLNADGKDEALVYLIGPDDCGSGGCTLLVLTPNGGKLRLVSSMNVTRTPIRVLATRSHGWNDISVNVGGGGLEAGERRLHFDGKHYPKNPTLPPAMPTSSHALGKVVISE